MRRTAIAVVAVLVALVAAAASDARTKTQHYTGRAGAGDAYTMSFALSGSKVRKFTFQSRCPGLKNGVTVAAAIKVKNGRFSYHDQQFTIKGRLLKNGRARGTERDVTGDCDSGTLTWAARRG